MSSNAPGQLLGYAIQFPRALYHLLCCGTGDIVCIEVFGDVATIDENGKKTSEEDKSSVIGNPVTDMSSDLWKTFYNWIRSGEEGFLDLSKTKFQIYTNRKGRKAIVDCFSAASDDKTAIEAIAGASKKLAKVSKEHEIWPYYNYCMYEKADKLATIIRNFEFIVFENDHGFIAARKELEKKLVPETQIDFLIESLSGWLQEKVMKMINEKKQPMIKWEDFRDKFLVLFDRVRTRELIDFTLKNPPHEADVKKARRQRPRYVQQLDKIGLGEEDILEAVSDYLRAKVNRDIWIEKEIIDYEVALDFEARLTKFWKNEKTKIELIHNKISTEKKAHLLYIECKNRQETIRDMYPPSTTIAGTYHALADGPYLGWHCDWEKFFKG